LGMESFATPYANSISRFIRYTMFNVTLGSTGGQNVVAASSAYPVGLHLVRKLARLYPPFRA
jgi:hypothetical protein